MLFYDINRAGRRIECELFLRDPAYQDAGIYRISGFSEFFAGNLCRTVQRCGHRNSHPRGALEAIKKKEHKATVQDTVCAYTLSNIQSTIASNTEEQYRKASSILINSGVKYIFSSRGSTCVGEFLNTILRQTLPHVYNYGSHGQNMFDFASDLGKGDAAVFITYSRYSRLMYLTAEMVHKQGASIILLTDKPTFEAAKFCGCGTDCQR